MERKAIQIVAYPDQPYALCDDGAIFQQSQGEWFELAPIPHTEKTGLTEAEITERIKELAAKHGMDAAIGVRSMSSPRLVDVDLIRDLLDPLGDSAQCATPSLGIICA